MRVASFLFILCLSQTSWAGPLRGIEPLEGVDAHDIETIERLIVGYHILTPNDQRLRLQRAGALFGRLMNELQSEPSLSPQKHRDTRLAAKHTLLVGYALSNTTIFKMQLNLKPVLLDDFILGEVFGYVNERIGHLKKMKDLSEPFFEASQQSGYSIPRSLNERTQEFQSLLHIQSAFSRCNRLL